VVAKGESAEPVNIGSAELVSINELVSIVEDIAGIQLKSE
jgi:GDP-D-mannose 3', 5'-epimerase